MATSVVENITGKKVPTGGGEEREGNDTFGLCFASLNKEIGGSFQERVIMASSTGAGDHEEGNTMAE